MLFVLGALALAACGPGPQDRKVECSDEAAGPPDGKNLVRLGVGGAASFTPIKDGDVIALDHGSQGGTHIWLDVQSWAPKRSLLNYVIQLHKSDGTLVGEIKGNAQTCGAGWVTASNERLVFDTEYWYGPPPTGDLKLTIAESDGVGTSVGQELTVRVQ
jgi:hypothetical protein